MPKPLPWKFKEKRLRLDHRHCWSLHHRCWVCCCFVVSHGSSESDWDRTTVALPGFVTFVVFLASSFFFLHCRFLQKFVAACYCLLGVVFCFVLVWFVGNGTWVFLSSIKLECRTLNFQLKIVENWFLFTQFQRAKLSFLDSIC